MVIKNLSIEVVRRNKKAIIVGLHPGTADSKLSRPFQTKGKEYFSPEFSAKKLVGVIDNKTTDDDGKIFAWDNTVIPY